MNSDLPLAAAILQGLIASGHYTEIIGDSDEEVPRPKRYDYGADWQKDRQPTRYPSYAVADAISLLNELKANLEHSD